MLDDMKYLACQLPEAVNSFKYAGMFDEEIELIDKLLSGDIPYAMKKRLEIERIIASGMKVDYSINFDEALKLMQEKVADFSSAELTALMASGAADFRLVGGKIHFHNYFYSSIMINSPILHGRLIDDAERSRRMSGGSFYTDNMQIMKEKGSRSFRFAIKHTICPADGLGRDGEKILVHIPLPLENDEQKNFKIISSFPEDGVISDCRGPQRTISFDTVYRNEMVFEVEYSYENTAYYHQLSVEKASAKQPTFYTEEQLPHIMFTPYLKWLAAEIAGDEKSPLVLAKHVYDYVTTKIKYSYMREYLLIDNISEFGALNFRGDCGVQALLFITLCRILGIPSRWQSGFRAEPDDVGSHDWAQFYIAPWGWLFADCSYGGGNLRAGRCELSEFYFGNLDPFRMAANSEFQAKLDPPKKFVRIDPYDNQLGEIEYSSGPLTAAEIRHKRVMLKCEEI